MFVSAGITFFADCWCKRFVLRRLRTTSVSLGPVVQLKLAAHRKKIYARPGARIAFVLVWLSAVAAAALLHLSGHWFQSVWAQVGLGVAIGGAAGNLFDILRWRYVVDFIDFGWWPVFNLADAAIISGLILAFCR